MGNDETNWNEISTRISAILTKKTNELPAEAIEFVQDYLSHNEYEIAFEGLCLDLMEQKLLTNKDISEVLVLGKLLGLDKESVLKDDFWARLTAYEKFLQTSNSQT